MKDPTKTLKQRIATIGSCIGIFFAAVIIAYAAVTWFMNKDYKLDFNPKSVRNFDITDSIDSNLPTEIGLEEDVFISPTVTNKGTEPIYVFIRLDVATYTDEYDKEQPIYSFTPTENGWIQVDTGNPGEICYAYASDSGLTVLEPRNSTSLNGSLRLAVDADTYAEMALASNDNFDIRVMGCVIDTDGSGDPENAYSDYKLAGGE